ncbi:3-hydroxyisobutyrate dehydrogenase/putative dehydrogenase [Pseudonocardia hierapolitana]|uniref:3-hydroxyisobutyrate dehydrogenase/putative dehydrogenase n=1 Tax=Pseudonocardia hierapolitana TaxID=1128676 RepID=A0A561SWS2_9PSEU|nr:NAD(P)-dependent oxidoreductase [Pseudonocardia hierapolitana]TWF79303.1 3-hydroxyisobutyrate dehydrogenase/putative dehydrogenase [Pseudonocardia hierapolitana]
MPTVTFVGIGAIGLPMARRLVDAGHDTTGVDTLPAALERAAAAGVPAVGGFGEAPRAEFVVAMVATPDQLDALVTDAVAGDVAGQCWIVMSTVGPESVRAQAERLTAAGAAVIDVPVTGGVARAATGELTLFASGPAADVAAARPVLEALGTVREVGDEVGDGQAVKVVNQHLCAVHIVAAAEALALAGALGLDRAQVLSFVEQGAAGSFMLSDRGPRMLQGTDVDVASAISIFVKDSGLVADAAAVVGARTPLLDVARARYLQAADAGLAARDDSRVIETYSEETA